MLPRDGRGEFGGIARVENLRAGGLQTRERSSRVSGSASRCEGFVERGAFFAVQHGVVSEVGGRFGLIGGDDVDEGLLGHGLERVIDAALLADGGDGFLADGFAAERAGAVRGIDEA